MRDKITWAAKRNLAAMSQAKNVAELDRIFVNGLFIARRAHKAGMIALADRMIESYEMNQMRLQFRKMQNETYGDAVARTIGEVKSCIKGGEAWMNSVCTKAVASAKTFKEPTVLAPNWVKSRVLPTPQMTPSFFEIVEISNHA